MGPVFACFFPRLVHVLISRCSLLRRFLHPRDMHAGMEIQQLVGEFLLSCASLDDPRNDPVILFFLFVEVESTNPTDKFPDVLNVAGRGDLCPRLACTRDLRTMALCEQPGRF
ncbi:hypothetical protein PM082_013621 [Marasmius tenuissimus]|nr:hypothetical protein PM082_013621 [Marasmius tenuissimus]